MRRPLTLAGASPSFLAKRDGAGRFEARPTLSARLFTPDFDERDARQRALALRDAGPLRIVALAPEGAREVASLAAPEPSWSFGAELAFSSSGEELFVAAPDLGRIFVYAWRDETWTLAETLRETRALAGGWRLRHRFVLVDDDHVWTPRQLLRRDAGGWRGVGELARPLAASRDWTTLVFEEPASRDASLGVRIARGTPYAWEASAIVRLWRFAEHVRVEADGARITLQVGEVPVVIERVPIEGWVQRGPIADPAHRVRIEQAPVALGAEDFARARDRALPWSPGQAYDAGTWIAHAKLGLGYVVARDEVGKRIVVRFEDGSERRLASG